MVWRWCASGSPLVRGVAGFTNWPSHDAISASVCPPRLRPRHPFASFGSCALRRQRGLPVSGAYMRAARIGKVPLLASFNRWISRIRVFVRSEAVQGRLCVSMAADCVECRSCPKNQSG